MAKLILRVKTVGANPGDEIEVADSATADYLVANGSAVRPATQKAAERVVANAAKA